MSLLTAHSEWEQRASHLLSPCFLPPPPGPATHKRLSAPREVGCGSRGRFLLCDAPSPLCAQLEVTQRQYRIGEIPRTKKGNSPRAQSLKV